MTVSKSFKILTFGTIFTVATASFAYAGEGNKDCKWKKTASEAAAVTPTATTYAAQNTPETQVLSEQASMKMKQEKKVYTFDEALDLCTSKQATDLQACIDKKTGQKPKS